MSNEPNTSERDYWSGPSGQTWIRHREDQDAILSEVTKLVTAHADLKPGGRALDIGCGTGALTRAVAKIVGQSGRVLAADISAPLLAETARLSSDQSQVATLNADAQTTDWPEDGFDVAVSRFGVMFFSDPAAAFSNIARALVPSGRLVFAAWGPYTDNPFWVEPQRIAAARLGRPPAIPATEPGPFGLSDRDWSLDRMRAAGLANIDCDVVTVGLSHPGGLEALAELSTRIGPAARVLRLFDGTEDDRLAVRDEIEGVFSDLATEGAVPATIHLFTARRG